MRQESDVVVGGAGMRGRNGVRSNELGDKLGGDTAWKSNIFSRDIDLIPDLEERRVGAPTLVRLRYHFDSGGNQGVSCSEPVQTGALTKALSVDVISAVHVSTGYDVGR